MGSVVLFEGGGWGGGGSRILNTFLTNSDKCRTHFVPTISNLLEGSKSFTRGERGEVMELDSRRAGVLGQGEVLKSST